MPSKKAMIQAESAVARMRYRTGIARDRLSAVDDWLRSRPQ